MEVKKIKDITKPGNAKMISWTAPRSLEYQRGFWWYFLISIAALGLGAFFFWEKEYLATGVVVLAAIVFFIQSGEKNNVMKYIISPDGISIGNETYPFENFKSFWITKGPLGTDLHLETTSRILPHNTIYLWKVDTEEISRLLVKYLPKMEGKKTPLNEQISRILRI